MISILLYYVTISRTKNFNHITDSLALTSSIYLCFLIIYFFELQLEVYFNWINFVLMYFSFIFIFTYSLISPYTCEKCDLDKIIQTDITLRWAKNNISLDNLKRLYKILIYIGKGGILFIMFSVMFCIFIQYKYVSTF